MFDDTQLDAVGVEATVIAMQLQQVDYRDRAIVQAMQ